MQMQIKNCLARYRYQMQQGDVWLIFCITNCVVETFIGCNARDEHSIDDIVPFNAILTQCCCKKNGGEVFSSDGIYIDLAATTIGNNHIYSDQWRILPSLITCS